MLVLSRRPNQAIVIDEKITIIVLDVRGGKVRLGVEAPREVPVYRQELLDATGNMRPSGSPTPAEEQTTAYALLPTTKEISETVQEEVTRAGGHISHGVEDGHRLFLRAVLPMSQQVAPKDALRAGIAVRTAGTEIRVRRYVFRQVCKNGAIIPQTVQTRQVERVGLAASSNAIAAVDFALREAVKSCLAPGAFSTAITEIKSATSREGDLGLLRELRLSRVSRPHAARLRTEIARRFRGGPDRSMFGLMNAVTSVARDETDPQIKWRLEELGGAIPAIMPPRTKPGGSRTKSLVAA